MSVENEKASKPKIEILYETDSFKTDSDESPISPMLELRTQESNLTSILKKSQSNVHKIVKFAGKPVVTDKPP